MNKIYKKMMSPNKKISYAQSKSIFLYSLLTLTYTENRALYLIYLSYILGFVLLILFLLYTCIHVVKIHCWLSGSPLSQEKIVIFFRRRGDWAGFFHQYLKYHSVYPLYFHPVDLCMGSVLVSQHSILSLVPEVNGVNPPFDSGAGDDGDGWEVFFCATGVLEGSSCCGNFVTCYGIWLCCMYSFAVFRETGLLIYMSLFAVSREAGLLVCIYSFAVSRETGLLIYMYFSSVLRGAGLLEYFNYFDVFHG